MVAAPLQAMAWPFIAGPEEAPRQAIGLTWQDEVLQTMNPAPLSNAVSSAMWGDWEGLTAVGHTFYGAFTGRDGIEFFTTKKTTTTRWF